MVNEPDKSVPTGALSSRDQEMTRVERRVVLNRRDPIKIVELTNGIIPPRPDITEGRDIYQRLAGKPLHVFSVGEGDSEEFIAVGSKLTAHETNGILYFAAPYKYFGFDTDDIINDWTALYENPNYEAIKKAHATMPGWEQYEASRELILGVLKRKYRQANRFMQVDPEDGIIPVIRWKKDADGKRVITLDPLDDAMRTLIAEELPALVTDPSQLDGGMGLGLLLAYSPDHTQWPERSPFGNNNSDITQPMGPTQVLAFAIRRIAEKQAAEKQAKVDPDNQDAKRKQYQVPDNQDVQQGPLLAAFDEYIETGEKPVVDRVVSPFISPEIEALLANVQPSNYINVVNILSQNSAVTPETTIFSNNYNKPGENDPSIVEGR